MSWTVAVVCSMRRVSAVRWLDRLRGDDVEVRIDAEPVAIHLQREGLLGRRHRILLLPPLLREDPQGGEVVLHLLERCQHRLPVACDLELVIRQGLFDLRLPLPPVEQRLRERRPERPDAAR